MELINGRTPEEIKFALGCDANTECMECAYCSFDFETMVHGFCCNEVQKDALALIKRLESERDAALAKVPKWISMKDKLPAEKDATEDGLVLCVLSDMAGLATSERRAWHWENIVDMADCFTHWMPLPNPPKEDAHE